MYQTSNYSRISVQGRSPNEEACTYGGALSKKKLFGKSCAHQFCVNRQQIKDLKEYTYMQILKILTDSLYTIVINKYTIIHYFEISKMLKKIFFKQQI